MSLKKYKTKRDLKKSPEPKPKIKKTVKGDLRFVIQEHHASHLHWDLRLELEGVLKSWAVPKVPSLNPDEKRLAIMVEDHPYDYQYFKGIIPFGYGAGTVKIWDKGTFHIDGQDKETSEKLMKSGLKKGAFHFTLQGKKLKGEFALIKLKNSKKENEWLLIKKKDKFSVSTKTAIKKKSPSKLEKVVMLVKSRKRASRA